MLWNIGSSGALIDCWSVRRACKRFITNRGDETLAIQLPGSANRPTPTITRIQRESALIKARQCPRNVQRVTALYRSQIARDSVGPRSDSVPPIKQLEAVVFSQSHGLTFLHSLVWSRAVVFLTLSLSGTRRWTGAAWCSTFSCLKTSQTGDSAGFQQLEHEAAWCSTFSCLKTSQTGDSAGFQSITNIHVSRYLEYRSNWNMRRPGAAHSVAWNHHKREIQLGFR
ncbi:hypothetical protein CSKR_106136 [Clonorchis sinensis]|uniref:Uncharacterized protein n=1 Tax=Clonorchis sinensis TaxID=79923 RepID=A0A3R7GAS7_CLOSI|nr:hypothetical protein CSKR_106136 [Clonorchis sinensis]